MAPLTERPRHCVVNWSECVYSLGPALWETVSLLFSLWAELGAVHIWITESFLPGAILDCYSLQASHAVTGTNWFNHQLLWSLKLLKVLAKLMNCNWMWNESLSPFPTISYQRLLYPCKVTGRRFRLEFNNGPCQRIELHSLWQPQLQFAFHTLLYKICIQLIHWIIGILWVSKEFTEWFVLKIHGILSICWLLGRDNERIPWFFTACRRTHFFQLRFNTSKHSAQLLPHSQP